jgi:hypothetical protein
VKLANRAANRFDPNSTGNQISKMVVSAKTASARSASLASSALPAAAILPVPPTQLPERAPYAFHASSPTQRCTTAIPTVAPTTTPTEPASITNTPLPITRTAPPTSTFNNISTSIIGST